MATAFGPERAFGLSAPPTFDNPSDHLGASMDALDDSSLGPQSFSRADLPPPNPHFVFPARQATPSSAPSSFSRATARRPMSAIESPTTSFGLSAETVDTASRSALPTFSFNPGASLPPDPHSPFLLNPSLSPYTPRNLPSPNRPAGQGQGHRRGGSEFVGGRLRDGNSIAVMSTSPTKSESGFASTSFQPPPRRSHRRGISGAISTNDLPILHPPVFNSFLGKGNSAPTSPTGFEPRKETGILIPPEPLAAAEAEIVPVPDPEESVTPNTVDAVPAKSSPKQQKSGARARVGFSDTLEFIPRPLSLVSSETSSTATARPGHSLSGSISSIVSAASPSGRDSPIPLSRSPTLELTDSRPSTAGAILERTQHLAATHASPRRRNSIPTLLHLAEAANVEEPEPSPTKSFKRWSFFARDPSTTSSSPIKARPHSPSSSDSTPKAVSAASSSERVSEPVVELPTTVTIKQKKSKKKSKKKKKVKGWAGAILPRKPKAHNTRSKSDASRPPTSQAYDLRSDVNDDECDTAPMTFDSAMPTVTVTQSPDLTDEKERGKRSEDSTYPMIDLDAALGPFNTPLPLNPEWEAAQRAAGNTGSKRRLHSAQGMKGFTGPGMHYHRRAESAPALPPFDPGRAAIQRFGSNSTMADVFEEDEEDDGNSGSDSSDQSSERDSESDAEVTPPAVAPRDPLLDVQDKASTHSSGQSVRRTSSSLSDKDQSATGSVRAERSKSSLHDSVILEEPPSIIFRTSNVFSDRTDSSDSANPSPRRFSNNNKELGPVDISPLYLPNPANMPVSPYAVSHSSSFPSPRSPISLDAQRISTAPSSVTDENTFHSLLMGEPGPEVRISVDYDIPSLTSSNSTMTRDSMFLPNPRMSQPTMREPRPLSVSSAAFGRRRSSLASLSRLISSSHGERSKLSMEVTLDNESTTKKAKSSKAKRLSRMMQFWKPNKDGTPQ
ncbi:hypothetical protein G7046_g24 [Stylonectria norvegica]|nr:hypothetical protein G7046_g24 [Stylonectria norvegica]